MGFNIYNFGCKDTKNFSYTQAREGTRAIFTLFSSIFTPSQAEIKGSRSCP